ncbi:MAG: hypothetical protein ACE5JJ_00970 [Nitrospinota bacterium]
MPDEQKPKGAPGPKTEYDYSLVEELPIPYCDFVRVVTSEKSVYLGFGQSHPDTRPLSVQIVAQLILDPKTAGELIGILLPALAQHEQKYGTKILPKNLQIVEAQSLGELKRK